MRIRIQFAKYGRMLYIGHLDVMRYFQKLLRRAEVDMAFSNGYSPHPILSFAAPLGVGIESGAEYADLEVNESASTKQMVTRLNAVTVPGIRILDWRLLPESAPNAMSSVAAADYCLTFRAGWEPEDADAYLEGLARFLERKEIVVEKATKKGSRVVDIRPLVYDCRIETGGQPAVFLQVSTGSTDNLKPELVLQAYEESAGLVWDERRFSICRLETYMNTAKEGEPRRLLPLRDAGGVIL